MCDASGGLQQHVRSPQHFILNRKQTFPGLFCECVSSVVTLVPQFAQFMSEQPLGVKLRLIRPSHSRLNQV